MFAVARFWVTGYTSISNSFHRAVGRVVSDPAGLAPNFPGLFHALMRLCGSHAGVGRQVAHRLFMQPTQLVQVASMLCEHALVPSAQLLSGGQCLRLLLYERGLRGRPVFVHLADEAPDLPWCRGL